MMREEVVFVSEGTVIRGCADGRKKRRATHNRAERSADLVTHMPEKTTDLSHSP